MELNRYIHSIKLNTIIVVSLVLVLISLNMVIYNKKIGVKSKDSESIHIDTNNTSNMSRTGQGSLQPTVLHFTAVGDNIIHDPLLKAAQGNDGFDFSPFYTHVKKHIYAADLAFINLETIMSGAKYMYSGYPQFNTPQDLEQNLIDTGFDIFNMSNNHVMDRGKNGAIDYLNYMKSLHNIYCVGMSRSEQESNDPVIIEKNGIKIAILAYTFGTNKPLPEDMPYLVQVFHKEKMTQDIKQAKQLADCVIVSMHWGVEYSHSVTSQQKSIANLLASLNVDVVLGMHPHVIEPVEWLKGHGGHKTLVFYSLGNFISYQTKPTCLLGAMADFDIIKSTDNKLTIRNEKVTPIVTHYEGLRNISVYPLDQYTAKLAQRHSANQGQFSLFYFNRISEQIFGNIYTNPD